jgi:isoquinoline 1-oxidoreductase alpha subunit
VHVDGVATRSCSAPVGSLAGKKISTIENLGETPLGKALQKAWLDVDVMQCGYCQAGQLMSASALLAKNPNPSQQEVDTAMQGNICRCACYGRIREAIQIAAKEGATVNV